MINIIFFLILIIFIPNIVNFIILPIYYESPEKNEFNNFNFIKKIYTNISLGYPPQNLKVNLNLNESKFLISKELYNISNSFTNDIINENNFYEKIKLVINSNPNNFNNYIYKNKEYYINYNFYITENKENIFGLKLSNNCLLFNENLIYFLKRQNYLKENVFYFDFEKNLLIIGIQPYEFNKEKYNNINYFSINTLDNDKTSIKFDKIIIGNNKYNLNNNNIIYFDVNYYGIKGTKEYYNYINKEYFNKYYKNNLCKKEYDNNIENIIIICNKKININNFPDLSFISNHINNSLVLTKNDLFYKKNNKYYFLISFDKYQNDNWSLGLIFMKKYQPIFEEEKNIIRFYINNQINYKNHKIKIKFLLNLFFLFIILLLTILLIKYYLNKPRKIRANELEENVEYKLILK